MRKELQVKIDRAIAFLQSIKLAEGEAIELAYSGGKDSDVILQLAKESGINFRAIYKNTTIDPPGTIKHVREMGVEVVQPGKNFATLIKKKGLPNRFRRFCCQNLKEYKILDKVIIGIRRSESGKRAKLYKEPTQCRFFGSKKEKNHVVAYYPILDWEDNDIESFIKDREIKLHSLYYREDGSLDVTRRLGCMCCPLATTKKRIAEFKKNPNMVRFYINNLKRYVKDHPLRKYKSVYEWFVRDVFYKNESDFDQSQKKGLFPSEINYKTFLENYFNIRL